MLKTISIISAAALLSACSWSPIGRGPDGGDLYSFNCGVYGIHLCYNKANEYCPEGYTVISQERTPSGIGALVNHHLTVECKQTELLASQ